MKISSRDYLLGGRDSPIDYHAKTRLSSGRNSHCTKEELLRQPITWNRVFHDCNGKVLGERPWLSWGPITAGPTQYYLEWKSFMNTPVEHQSSVLFRSKEVER